MRTTIHRDNSARQENGPGLRLGAGDIYVSTLFGLTAGPNCKFNCSHERLQACSEQHERLADTPRLHSGNPTSIIAQSTRELPTKWPSDSGADAAQQSSEHAGRTGISPSHRYRRTTLPHRLHARPAEPCRPWNNRIRCRLRHHRRWPHGSESGTPFARAVDGNDMQCGLRNNAGDALHGPRSGVADDDDRRQ